ncbi:hypothetical protein VNO78_24690 [Psophocarpus tetragonolobus]|uniref:Uncharacterized protein n=1 Tax=Psophocarpus tetragonolobus TaxID=3891 RepID=A0AAN9XF85_PSOTE
MCAQQDPWITKLGIDVGCNILLGLETKYADCGLKGKYVTRAEFSVKMSESAFEIKTVTAIEGGALSFTEPQMLLRETFHKTKIFFHRNFRNFWSFLFGEYQQLPRSLSFNPFLCRIGNARTKTSDQFYNEFYDMLQSDLGRIRMYGDSISRSAMEDAACTGSFTYFAKQSSQKSIHEDKAQDKKNKGSLHLRKKEDLTNPQSMNKKARVLAQKMKTMDMMDGGDLEHVLDIEEALHYYSRLKSPVYLDIVDKFFMDIQSELSVPQPCTSFKPSNKRLGPIRLR